MSRPSTSRREPIVHRGHIRTVGSVQFLPDGKTVVSGSLDRTIRFWSARSTISIGTPLRGHASLINSISCSPRGDMVASGSDDRTIRLWNIKDSQQVGQPLKGHFKPVRTVAFSPDGNLIASGSDDATICLWGAQDLENVISCRQTTKSHTDWVRSISFSPDGTWMVSGSRDMTVRIWDVESGTMILEPLKGHTQAVCSVAFCPDGSHVVSGSWDKTLRLWDVRDGSMVGSPFEGHTAPLCSVTVSPDGRYIASGSEDCTIRLWDVRQGHQVYESWDQHTGIVASVAFSPCGKRIASGSGDETVMIWCMPGSDSDEDSQDEFDDELEPSGAQADLVGQHMSMEDMFNLLLRHGCVDLSSRMDVNQESAILVSGGGFGDIWKGKMNNGTKVAIKAWRASLIEECDYKTLKRATREIHYWSKMKHENVHQLMGVIILKNQSLGMVSEWMDNGNLHEYLRKSPSVDRFQLSIQAASGLAYIHDQNMIHGDIKGLNVLISSGGAAKLTDFGLSTMSEASITFSATTTAHAGSIRWVAPELLLEESSKSKASDVYALGMTILV